MLFPLINPVVIQLFSFHLHFYFNLLASCFLPILFLLQIASHEIDVYLFYTNPPLHGFPHCPQTFFSCVMNVHPSSLCCLIKLLYFKNLETHQACQSHDMGAGLPSRLLGCLATYSSLLWWVICLLQCLADVSTRKDNIQPWLFFLVFVY